MSDLLAVKDLGSIGVICPHLDDAALSCGQLLSMRPGAHVITVFSGGPRPVKHLSPWDKACGFSVGDDVMGIRACEDDEAMRIVDAQAHRLDFWDVQYRTRSGVRLAGLLPSSLRGKLSAVSRKFIHVGASAEVVDKLVELIGEHDVDTWVIPLGVGHPDHRSTARACVEVATYMRWRRWVVYEDQPYRVTHPGELQAAKEQLQCLGFRIKMIPLTCPGPASLSSVSRTRKLAMVSCYRSQVRGLGANVEIALRSEEIFYLLEQENALSRVGGRT